MSYRLISRLMTNQQQRQIKHNRASRYFPIIIYTNLGIRDNSPVCRSLLEVDSQTNRIIGCLDSAMTLSTQIIPCKYSLHLNNLACTII